MLGLAGLIASFFSIIYGYSRLVFALSRAGHLPQALSLASKRKASTWALVVPGIFVLVVSPTGAGDLILAMAVVRATRSYALMAASHILLRINQPERPRPYKTPGDIVTSGIALMPSLIALTGVYAFDPRAFGYTLVLFVVGALYFFGYSRNHLLAKTAEEEFRMQAQAQAQAESDLDAYNAGRLAITVGRAVTGDWLCSTLTDSMPTSALRTSRGAGPVEPHERYGLTRIINAAGTFTPLGVSRSSEHVRRVVGETLGEFFVIDELQRAVSDAVCAQTKAEAAAVTHCVAAGITLAVAATMTGDDAERVAQLPDTTGLANRVVIPAGHVVNYGHSILTAIRMAGAQAVVVGDQNACSVDQIEQALKQERTASLLLVSSRLVRGESVDLAAAVACAHRHHRPAIIDGAAQDMRMNDLLATGADLVLVSAHKYLASPTAGLMIGAKTWVRACRAQERGIGQAMKATKESLIGVLAALEDRAGMDVNAWQQEQACKVAWFERRMDGLEDIVHTSVQPDPSGMPLSRLCLTLDSRHAAESLAAALENGSPSIRIMKHGLDQGQLLFELVPLDQSELEVVVERLRDVLSRHT